MPKSIADRLKNAKAFKPRQILWRGPEDHGPMGGITQSMLARYPVCPERFRVNFIEGWQARSFSARMEYGSMWHVCEECLAQYPDVPIDEVPWKTALLAFCKQLGTHYPLNREDIGHWYKTCLVQFPMYHDYWKDHEDVKERIPLVQEYVFKVPYKLPSGRVVWLRGKFDSVDQIAGKLYLQENKTKGSIDFMQLERQLTFDLQTMMYLVVIDEDFTKHLPIGGVRYNVIRRPFSGGKGSITRHKSTQGARCAKCKGEGRHVQKKGEETFVRCEKCGGIGRIGAKEEETEESFYGRLRGIIDEEPDSWFKRWTVPISRQDLDKFKTQFLDPALENLCDDYAWWSWCFANKHDVFDWGRRNRGRDFSTTGGHFRLPFGIYNVIAEGGSSDLDAYLVDGNTAGLTRVTSLFDELKESKNAETGSTHKDV